MPLFKLNTNKIGLGSSLNGIAGGLKSMLNVDTILSSLNSAWKTALFMEAMRNLNWSRNYLWYVELDGVPSPFQRGGVLGLPCKDIQFTLAKGESFSWDGGINKFSVPQGIGGTTQIQLTLMDDEKGTLRQFFERWFNQIYHPCYGVLPVSEACKQISIYLQKSTRRNIKRIYYDMDRSISKSLMGRNWLDLGKAVLNKAKDTVLGGITKSTDSIDFLVYPVGDLQLSLSNGGSDLITFSVTLEVAYFINQDFGNPNVHSGVDTLLDTEISGIQEENDWLSKISNYI